MKRERGNERGSGRWGMGKGRENTGIGKDWKRNKIGK